VISRKSVIEILVVASILIIARLAFDFTSAAAYVIRSLTSARAASRLSSSLSRCHVS
jgi:hypothetical protein